MFWTFKFIDSEQSLIKVCQKLVKLHDDINSKEEIASFAKIYGEVILAKLNQLHNYAGQNMKLEALGKLDMNLVLVVSIQSNLLSHFLQNIWKVARNCQLSSSSKMSTMQSQKKSGRSLSGLLTSYWVVLQGRHSGSHSSDIT